MKFIDEATIKVHAGHGGAGCKSFRREKFVPLGGPDGGNGGAGGSIVVVADSNTHTLLDFRFQPFWSAKDGLPGEGSNRSGRSGDDLIIRLPVGTQVLNSESGDVVCDLAHQDDKFVLAKGGRGGKGNDFFKSATNQAPEHHQPGEDGEKGTYLLSLKLVADVGLIGFPNAGKSTLISRVSSAKPKIADYPFTTLVPNLGVVKSKSGQSFVVADIPGLIPGAHEGKGLGIKFLKHVERTRVLVHLIDPYQVNEQGETIDAMEAFDSINFELKSFSEDLAARPQIVAISKSDISQGEDELKATVQSFKDRGFECIAISSAAGRGIPEIIELMSKKVFEV